MHDIHVGMKQATRIFGSGVQVSCWLKAMMRRYDGARGQLAKDAAVPAITEWIVEGRWFFSWQNNRHAMRLV